jgi:leader peptidase (prepilin peptidase) / N-methyltransferase
MTDPTFAGLVGVFGLLVGSFLNVCIYRLPRRETILWGRSHCPHCSRQIRAWENVPILSWAMLGGRCAGCQAPISLQYPLVELATGVVFAATAWLVGPTLLLLPRLLFGAAMIVLFMIDLNDRILPNVITLPGIVAGLLFSLVGPPGLRDALIGAVACSLALWGVGEAVSRALGKDALGFGDVKMVAMMGAFLGWKVTLVALFLASFLGSLIGLALVAITRNRDYLIPLGSFLAIGALAASAVGDPLVAWYVSRMLGP